MLALAAAEATSSIWVEMPMTVEPEAAVKSNCLPMSLIARAAFDWISYTIVGSTVAYAMMSVAVVDAVNASVVSAQKMLVKQALQAQQ